MAHELSNAERAALRVISSCDDVVRLRNFISNARKEGSEIVESEAFKRLCAIQPRAEVGTVEHDVWMSIHALEQMLLEERGRTVRLSRTRQKISRDGEAKTAADLTLRSESSQGFSDLIERGYPELTFEAVVLRHPEVFDHDTMHAAQERLESVGLDPKDFLSAHKGD